MTGLVDCRHAVEADDLAPLHSLITGLRRDLDAVVAMPWSSGAGESNVNRIKTIKRQMYGLASLELLRQRVLLDT